MNTRRITSICLTALITLPMLGQGRQVLADGISGEDRIERYLFIQAISPHGDTCLVMTDSLGRFEIDPDLMDGMRGNVYLKPMATKPKPKLVIDSPFDSIHVYRQQLVRYQVLDLAYRMDCEDPVFYFDPETELLSESVVKAKRHGIARDKVTGYLDSLAILVSGEWVCDCHASSAKGYLNNYHGYSHHPEGYNPPPHEIKHLMPKRGETYRLIKYLPGGPDGRWLMDMNDPPRDIVYAGPQYSEEELLEMNGMWKVQGYYPKREFYEPDTIDLASPTPDFRNLLQWKPAVLTDENGVAEISFGASEVNTEFIGVVEALDGVGLVGCHTFSFRVYKL